MWGVVGAASTAHWPPGIRGHTTRAHHHFNASCRGELFDLPHRSRPVYVSVDFHQRVPLTDVRCGGNGQQ